MTTAKLIKYLRLNVNVQMPESVVDSAYLAMSDEDLLLYMDIALTRDFPKVPSLEYLPNADVYPLILLTKKELYYALATKDAPKFDLGADNNNYLKQAQRFEHYMKLVAQVDKEYSDYLENGGAGSNTLTSYDVTLSDRHNTRRNYEKGVAPALSLYVDSVTQTAVELSWDVQMSRFLRYRVYFSTSEIVDLHNVSNHIRPEARLMVEITDFHQKQCRIEGLSPSSTYYFAVEATDRSQLKDYAETVVTTPAPVVVTI